MKEHTEHRDVGQVDRPLAVYLRDHFAGATAGLALVRRCRREHAGTPLDTTLAGIEAQIDEDRRSLEDTMARLGIRPSGFKSALGSLGETVGRLKGNGRSSVRRRRVRSSSSRDWRRASSPNETCGARCGRPRQPKVDSTPPSWTP